MDYFAKFKKRIVAPRQQPTTAMQLAKFHKCWDYVHNILMVEDRKANVHVQQTEIPSRLRQMMDMLVDEEARQEDNTTGVCMEYFLKNGILQYLVNVSEKSDNPVGIRGEAIRTIANMVDLLDDRFLVHNAVHKPTIKLLRFCVIDERQSDLYHEDLVDLMYIICSKIHGFPALLNIFFHDKQWLTTPQKTHTMHTPVTLVDNPTNGTTNPLQQQQQKPSPPKKPEYEFLLFTYLLRFVHREGRTGDFARTGLLFIMEMATHQLGDFIIESDFATIMAAGLGALYSQLPRKLMVKDEAELNSNLASFLIGQDIADPRYTMPGVEKSSSPEFKYQLDSFLKLFEFCQDVLTRCPNTDISMRLLHSIRTIFLENILYPSILECSDTDGSSVAVISYIDLILQILQQDDLANVVVGFLMDEDEHISIMMQQQEQSTTSTTTTPYGNNVFAGIELDQFKNSPYFTAAERFTLKDLIFSRLKSSSQPTVVATLKLLKTLITRHCRYSLKLLSIYPDNKRPLDDKSTIISHHLREIELYFSLISAVDQAHAEDIMSFGYEEYLKDIEQVIDNDMCYQTFTGVTTSNDTKGGPRTPKSERRRSFKYGQRFDQKEIKEQQQQQQQQQQIQSSRRTKMFKHGIQTTDPLLQILLGLLSHFFAQSPELNLVLTGVISALAICPYRSLEGWIAFKESDRTKPDDVLILDASDQLQRARISNGENGDDKDSICGKDIYAQFETTAVNEDAEDDDRSIDYGVEHNSTQMTQPTQFKSFPPFFTLFRTLTQQVDYYRSEVDGFDRLLHERRNGLMIGDTQPDSGVSMTASSSTSTRSSTIVPNDGRRPSIMMRPSLSTTINGTASAAAAAVAGAVVSSASNGTTANGSPVIMPTKSISSSTTASPPPQQMLTNNPLSPLAIHTRKAQTMRIQPLFPSNFITEIEEPILDLDEDDEDTFAPKATNPSQQQRRRMDKSTEISLSTLLNNVVILEETIKELVAIMQVRRSVGIDVIRYA
ncbi:Retinoic acid induced 16-like protein-domain-containing protein [Phascolomyces articulosus]|uniref:Retinoic acid induced 16-like protein-domain-containing protein n=1 Tax=Phascolomyces articulosus TaxID=60185 RepID=A0AAD5KXI2_9FUNG|nr:Retinoic acid induced 16-like protein-domain-containing protein [Phascolomyces articulosus]